MTFSDEVLMAYADDELDAQMRAAVDAAMDSDPEIRRRIAQHKALRSRFHTAFNRVLDEPVPLHLVTVVRGDGPAARASTVVPLHRRQTRRWTWPQWTAIAASLIVGVMVGQLALLHTGDEGPIVMRDGRMLAQGTLAHALSDQLASAQSATDPVRIGVSFRAKSGEYCRTFILRQPGGLAGLACHAAEGWQVGALARTESPVVGSGGYRQAASPLPPAVMAAVGNRITGEPLDQRSEAAARARKWQP